MSTPTTCVLNSSAALRSRTSALGRCPLTRGSSHSTAMSPMGSRLTLMCRLPGQISTRPGSKTSPDWASFTRSGDSSSSRRANMSVKPSGMCWTTTTDPGKSAGNCDNTNSSACGPPVEIPMATILVGEPAAGASRFSGRATIPGRILGLSLQSAAALTLLMSSFAVSARCMEASRGLATKSNAPSPRAFKVMDAPPVLCELKTMTGTGWRRMISFSVSMPFMPGISRSSVTTLGFNSSIFFRQNVPSMAVPTTSMESSACNICGISLRISAESSTTSTRTGFFFMPALRLHSGPCACDRYASAEARNLRCLPLAAGSVQDALLWRAGSGSEPLCRCPE